MMTDSTYEILADSLLAALEEGIGGDTELHGGVLTVEGEAGTWLVVETCDTTWKMGFGAILGLLGGKNLS